MLATYGDNEAGTCVEICPDGYYGDNSTRLC